MQEYYESFRPASMAEGLGLPVDAKSPLGAMPPYKPLLPWAQSIRGLADVERRRAQKSWEHFGAAKVDKPSGPVGTMFWGPIAPALGEAEFLRLTKLHEFNPHNWLPALLKAIFSHAASREWLGLLHSSTKRQTSLDRICGAGGCQDANDF